MAKSSSEYNGERSAETQEDADWELEGQFFVDIQEDADWGLEGAFSGTQEGKADWDWELSSMQSKRKTWAGN